MSLTKTLMGGLLLRSTPIGAGFAAFKLLSGRRQRHGAEWMPGHDRKGRMLNSSGVDESAKRYLLYFLLPFWLLPGLADWASHKKSDIEHTSGTPESLMHLLMYSEVGLPIVAGLFFEINALMLRFMIGMFLIHELTAYADNVYAFKRREVSPGEELAHSFLEVLPFTALSILVCMHWDQLPAALGIPGAKGDWGLRLKRKPLSWKYRIGIMAAVALVNGLPYLEELIRCYRCRHLRAQNSATF